MLKNSAMEVVEFMKDRLIRKGLNIQKIILFGSQAKGGSVDESDIDIIIVSPDFKGKDIFKRARLTKDAEIMTIKEFLIPLDVITMTPEELASEDSIMSDYAMAGNVVYETKLQQHGLKENKP